jgi:hypothetical protein
LTKVLFCAIINVFICSILRGNFVENDAVINTVNAVNFLEWVKFLFSPVCTLAIFGFLNKSMKSGLGRVETTLKGEISRVEGKIDELEKKVNRDHDILIRLENTQKNYLGFKYLIQEIRGIQTPPEIVEELSREN